MSFKKHSDSKNSKFCIKCEKNFNEKENFNWSCITHQGLFNYENNIWWCCGKIGIKAKGCKQ